MIIIKIIFGTMNNNQPKNENRLKYDLNGNNCFYNSKGTGLNEINPLNQFNNINNNEKLFINNDDFTKKKINGSNSGLTHLQEKLF